MRCLWKSAGNNFPDMTHEDTHAWRRTGAGEDLSGDGLRTVPRKCTEGYDIIINDSTDPFGYTEGLFPKEFLRGRFFLPARAKEEDEVS